MSTHPTGKDTKTVGINMTGEMADELIQRAGSMHLSVSKYCKIVLNEWLDSGKKLNLTER